MWQHMLTVDYEEAGQLLQHLSYALLPWVVHFTNAFICYYILKAKVPISVLKKMRLK